MTDWTRVTRGIYRVRQHYRYTYTAPVRELRQRLVMIPRDRFRDQRLLSWSLDVRGTDGDHRILWETDSFGNRVARVFAPAVARAIDFEVNFQVERNRQEAATERDPWPAGGPRALLDDTPLTAPDARVEAAARRIADETRDRRQRAEYAHEWASRAIRYQPGITGYRTPAAMALHLGRGVCQDYAHVLLAMLRLLGVPCRYVSGHLLGEGAPHAWVEALLPDPGDPQVVEAVAYDPTHARRTRMDYLTVAVGRDFADVTPTSGMYTGPGAGKLSASKEAALLQAEMAEAVA